MGIVYGILYGRIIMDSFMFNSFVLWGLVCTMSWAFVPGIIALASPKGADGAFATYLTLNIGIKLISIEPSRRRSFNYLAFGA